MATVAADANELTTPAPMSSYQARDGLPISTPPRRRQAAFRPILSWLDAYKIIRSGTGRACLARPSRRPPRRPDRSRRAAAVLHHRRRSRRLTNCDCVASGGTPVRLSWSRNGRFIVFAASQEIYRYDLKRKRLTRVFDGSRRADTAGEFYSHATVDPSGTKVALQYTDGASASGIRIIDLGTGRRTLIPSPEFQLVPGPNGDSIVKPGNYYAAPSFSPNGKRLAITVADGYNPDNQPLDHPAGIYSIDLNGGDFRLIQRVGRTDFNSTGYGWSLTWGS